MNGALNQFPAAPFRLDCRTSYTSGQLETGIDYLGSGIDGIAITVYHSVVGGYTGRRSRATMLALSQRREQQPVEGDEIMEAIIVLAIVASLVLLDVLALRFGADSRITDKTRPNW